MSTTIAWLNANSGAVSATAAVVSALAAVVLMGTTIMYVVYTWQLAVENRLLRKAGTEPQVVAYATINPRVFPAIDFVVRNVGRGAARNVSYKIVSGGDDLEARNVRLLRAGVSFAFLPQDDQLSASMGMGWDLLEDPAIKPFDVEVSFEDLTGKKHSNRFKIDVGQFEGLGRLGQPADEQIADALKKIAKTMEDWGTRRLQVGNDVSYGAKRSGRGAQKRVQEQRAKRQAASPPAEQQG